MKPVDSYVIAWVGLSSAAAFLLFGYDKWCAGRPGRSRVPEFRLALAGALGGWPGGLLGMVVFRHKTAKLSFQIKYLLSLLAWLAGLAAWWHWR
ncbi:MAG: DUF1294 domain-containing protein [Verrucomicrobiota bacterium]